MEEIARIFPDDEGLVHEAWLGKLNAEATASLVDDAVESARRRLQRSLRRLEGLQKLNPAAFAGMYVLAKALLPRIGRGHGAPLTRPSLGCRV